MRSSNLKENFYSPVDFAPSITSTKRRKNLKIYKSSRLERLSFRIEQLNKIMMKLTFVGVCGCAVLYFGLVCVEESLYEHYTDVNASINQKQDMEDFVARNYSWRRLHEEAESSNMLKAKKVLSAD